MSNLKQINLGMLQYTQDYDETYPNNNDGSKNPSGYGGWTIALQPYLKSSQLLQCPSDSTVSPTTPDNAGFTDYAMNLTLGYSSDGVQKGLNMAALTQPSLTVSICEDLDTNPTAAAPVSRAYFWSAGEVAQTNKTKDVTARAASSQLATFRGAAQRHLDGANFAFADGHAKWYKASSATRSSTVYSWNTPLAISGNNPTFNPSP